MIKIKHKLPLKAIAVVIVFAMLLSLLNITTVFAANFSSGSGTKNDPYLIKTAKDLDNMRSNLSAHYKLAATIDMSSFGAFEPIGTSKQFTGSFSCDLGKDGIPRYAILNLKVYNSIGKDYNYKFGLGNYAGYGEDGIHYYAALFGKTKGATLTNIVLLGVNIENTVVGQHGGAADEKGESVIVKTQVDDQGTAGLIALADSTTVSGCGVQGKIVSKSNKTAGLIGFAENGSSILNSWADCTFDLQGYWNNAGFIGGLKSSNVQSCYAKGKIDFTDNHSKFGLSQPPSPVNGFVKKISADSVISDCYSQVDIKLSSGAAKRVREESYVFATIADDSGICKNCYVTGALKGGAIKSTDEENPKAINCWILNTSGTTQPYFKGGAAKEIKAAFSGQSSWDTSGEMPTLKNIKYINDYSIFVAGQEREGAGVINSVDNGASSATSQNSNSSATSEGSNSSATNENTDSSTTNESSDSVSSETNHTENEIEGEGTGEETIVETSSTDENSTIVFWCLIVVSIALSALSLVTLFKALKIKQYANSSVEKDDEEEEYE